MFRYTEEAEQKKTLVVSDSRYGTVDKYVSMLANQRDVDVIDARGAKLTKVRAYRTILFVGSVYEGKIGLLDTAEKLVRKLKEEGWQNRDTMEYDEGHRFGFLAVGLSSGEECEALAGWLAQEIPFFFAKGRLDPAALSSRDALMISLWGKLPEEELPRWKKEMLEAVTSGEVLDETDESYLDPLLDVIDGRF